MSGSGTFALAAALAFAAAASSGQVTEPGDPAEGQPSANPERLPRLQPDTDDLVARYGSYREAAAATMRDRFAEIGAQAGNSIDFGTCSTPLGGAVTESRLDESLSTVALRYAWARAQLEWARFPLELYEEELDGAEMSDAEQALDRDEFSTFELAGAISAIERARAEQRPDLPEIVQSLCPPPPGAAAHLRSNPPGGTVWFISDFHFQVCRARRVDPWSVSACRAWAEADSQQPMPLHGLYMYQARWPGGATGRGRKRIVGYSQSGAPPVYTVEPGTTM